MKTYSQISMAVFFVLGIVACLCQDVLAAFIAGLAFVLFHAVMVEKETDDALKEMDDGE